VTRIVHLLTLVAVNAVPAAGWFIEDWSARTTLLVYWFENVAGVPVRGCPDSRPSAAESAARALQIPGAEC
jgi:cytochrome b561